MMDQLLHFRQHSFLVREQNLRVRRIHRAIRQIVDGLLEDAHALPHLLHAYEIAVVAVADTAKGYIEIEILIGTVGMRLADVPIDSRTTEARAGDTQVDRVLLSEDADA